MDEVLLSDLLECSVCLDRLDTSSRVLPCQHTFCRKCLEEIVATKKELRCPECRVLVAKSIDELPPNVLLMRILEGMKNAGNPIPRKKAAPVQKQPPNLSPSIVTSANLSCTGDTPKKSVFKEPGISGPPLGRALFDYQSQEPGDLSFRKGEMITLLNKIDTHWAQGECAGRTGMFPLTFVQVLTPVPPQVATCRALYDFRMNNEEVEGCLSFHKDEVLAVVRRVDENWIEGRLNGRIGIFPLAFVELNSVAKALMKLSLNEQPGPSRLAPPTPNGEASPFIQSDSPNHTTPDRLIVTSSDSSRPTPGPMAPVLGGRPSPPVTATPQPQTSRPAASDSSSTTTTTPNSTSNSSSGSSSSTAASSPASPLQTATFQKTTSPPAAVQFTASPSTPVGVHQKPQPVQRCVQSPMFGGIQSSPQQIASPQESLASPQQQPAATETPQMTSSNPFMRPQTILLPTSHITAQQRDKRHSFTAITSNQPATTTNRHSAEILSVNEPATTTTEPSRATPAVSSSEVRTSGVGQSRDPVVPSGNGLVRQGSQRHRRSGSDFAVVHLPAAYVALYPYKPQKADELELKKGGVYLVTERCQDGWFKGTSNRTQKCGVFPGNYVTLAKPIQNSHSRVVSSSPRDCSSPNPTPVKTRTPAPAARQSVLVSLAPPELPPRSASPAVRPARHPWGLPSSTPPPESDSAAAALVPKCDSSSAHAAHISNTISPPPNVSVALSPTSARPADKVKEKKEKSGIMKRLAAIKRSKSPTVPAYSMDNPVFEDSTVSTASPSLHVAHSRSGSCPSQLLHLPVGVQSQRVMSSSLSARATRQKERPSVGAAHFTQSPSRIDGPQTAASLGNHRKSSSLDAGDPRNAKHLVPAVRERFRCIVPYPPNSEYELELRVGDIIYVHRKREDGWYKGLQQRTGRTGLFPASFVESY